MNAYTRNTKERFIFLLIIFCGYFIFVANAHCDDWIILEENHVGEFVYDETSISMMENGMVAVCLMVFMSTDMSHIAAEVSPDLKGSSYILLHNVIDCRERTYEITRDIYYDKKGKLLYDSEIDESEYDPMGLCPIPPNTPIQKLADTVCRIKL